MSASSIPHLSTLRGRTGLRGRSRGRGHASHDSSFPSTSEPSSTAPTPDQIVQATDTDAVSARHSAVSTGYLSDDYADLFIDNDTPLTRRYPIINRGTYVRTTAIDTLIHKFLSVDRDAPKQIISLGAGSDTRPPRFMSKYARLKYHEIDFENNARRKMRMLESEHARNKHGLVVSDSDNDTAKTPYRVYIHGDHVDDTDKSAASSYIIHGIDLREFASTRIPSPDIAHLNPVLPTLILSECCLCYSPTSTASAVMASLMNKFPLSTPVASIFYEPIRPDDAFGRTMTSNLGARGISMPTVSMYPSLETHRVRLREAGFVDGQGARDIHGIYYGLASDGEEWISEAERARIESLEWLDEIEEWTLLARHYCVAWAWRNAEPSTNSKHVFDLAWGSIQGHATSNET